MVQDVSGRRCVERSVKGSATFSEGTTLCKTWYMNLSYKATQFIIEAIEYQIKAYQERIDMEDLDEDEASDIINDSGFLEALCRDLRKNLNEGKTPDVLKSSDSSSVGITDRSSEELVKQVLQLSMNERLLLVDAITESIRQEFQSRQAQESFTA